MAVLCLRFCARAFSSCGERGPLFIAVRGPLTIAASLVAEHRLQTRMLSSCGSRAQLLRGTWDLPRPGLEPASPALAGRLSTTAPPGKPLNLLFSKPPPLHGTSDHTPWLDFLCAVDTVQWCFCQVTAAIQWWMQRSERNILGSCGIKTNPINVNCYPINMD